MFQTVPVSTISSFSLYTQQYTQVCQQLAGKPSANPYNIYHCVYSEELLMMDR